MSVDNFLVIAGYGLWIYILVCVIAKLNLYSMGRKKEEKKKAKIKAFLSAKTPCEGKEKQRKRIQRYADKAVLFEEICKTYTEEKQEYEEKDRLFYENFMKDIFHKKIKRIGPRDELRRCMLVQNLLRCELRSVPILAFIGKSKDENRMVDLLIQLEKEENKS